MINPVTGQEDPNYQPPSTGIINGAATPATPSTPTGIGTTPISTGSVSDQLDTILGKGTTQSTTSNTPSYNWNVTPDQTVEGRVAGIIDNKALSPLMEHAQAGARESANARGLINTSMANQAGQAAVMDAALPIAQSDAATKAQAAQFNAGFYGQKDILATQQGYNVENMNQAAGIALKMYDTQLQGDMAKMAKSQGYNMDTMSAQQVNDLAKAAVLQGYDLSKMDKASSDALKMLDASTLSDMTKMEKQYGYDLSKMDAKQINDLALQAEDNRAKVEYQKVDNDNKVLLAGLDNTNRTDLANIQAKYQTVLGTNKTAADTFNTVLTNITNIQNDPKIDGVTITSTGKTAKDNAIDLQKNLLRAAYGVIGGVAEMDLGGLLGFGEDTTPGGAGGDTTGGGIFADMIAQNEANNNATADLAARQAVWDAAPASIGGKRLVNGAYVTRPTV